MDMRVKGLAHPKGEPRARVKRRQRREEAAVVRAVRAEVFGRDVICRVAVDRSERWPHALVDVRICRGDLTLAHLLRRSATRRMAPRKRHTVDQCIVLCQRHHEMEERHELTWRYLTDRKADGPIAWEVRR